MGVTTVRLQPDLEQSLDAVSAKQNRSKSWLINQALKEYIDRAQESDSRWTETLAAIDSVQSGRVVAADSVHNWLQSWGTTAEKRAPKAAK